MTDRFCVAAAQATQGGGGTQLQLSQTTKDATKALQDDLGRKQRAVAKNVGCLVCIYIYIWDTTIILTYIGGLSISDY